MWPTKLVKRRKKTSLRHIAERMSQSHSIIKRFKKGVCMPCVCRNAEVGPTMMNVTCKSSGPPLVANHSPSTFSRSFLLQFFLAGFSLAWEGLLEGPFPFSRHLFFFSLFSDWNQKRLGVWCQKITEFEFRSLPPAARWATIYLFTKSLGGDKTISWKECYTKHSKSHFEKT